MPRPISNMVPFFSTSGFELRLILEAPATCTSRTQTCEKHQPTDSSCSLEAMTAFRRSRLGTFAIPLVPQVPPADTQQTGSFSPGKPPPYMHSLSGWRVKLVAKPRRVGLVEP